MNNQNGPLSFSFFIETYFQFKFRMDLGPRGHATNACDVSFLSTWSTSLHPICFRPFQSLIPFHALAMADAPPAATAAPDEPLPHYVATWVGKLKVERTLSS